MGSVSLDPQSMPSTTAYAYLGGTPLGVDSRGATGGRTRTPLFFLFFIGGVVTISGGVGGVDGGGGNGGGGNGGDGGGRGNVDF